jgi:hypothetical protein
VALAIRFELSAALAERVNVAQPNTLDLTGFRHVQLTYRNLTVASSEAERIDGETLAVWDEAQNCWVIAASSERYPEAAVHNDLVFSDVIIMPDEGDSDRYHAAQREQTGKVRDYSDRQ